MPREDRERSAKNQAHDKQVKHHLKYLIVNASARDEDEIYPITVSEIPAAQQKHRVYKRYFKDEPFQDKDPLTSLKLTSETKVLVYNDKHLVIPTTNMQLKAVQWYHHYLQHPDEKQLAKNIVSIMWWRGMQAHMRKHVKSCVRCQLGKRCKRKY